MINNIGDNWLLLRGLARETEHWGAFTSLLQTVFPLAQIKTLDLPGTGQYYQQSSPSNISEITNQIRQQAYKQGLLEKPLTLVALSMGGMVAWEWMQKYPDDINAAVLINTSFASLSPFYQRLRWKSYAKLASIILTTNIYQREQAILKLVTNNRQNDAVNIAHWHEIQTRRPVNLSNSLRQIIAAARYKPTNEKPKQAVLLLNSWGDRLVDPACSIAIQKKWHIDLHTHPWAGHDLSLDDSNWLAHHLKIWIESHT
ncbi:alpha/beta hydrolase [Methylomonas sp. AM2-LC]|uniref:alpha/beta fold hydrolase n=1 Tax=Methylomonas sp. AM2-LC TaxID=3153301 RepID=UPI003267B395